MKNSIQKIIVLIALSTMLFSACTSKATQNYFTNNTNSDQPIDTATPTLEPSPIPTITPTAVQYCNDQDYGNLTDAGIPETPTRSDGIGGWVPAIDAETYNIYQRMMHNRVVTLAIEKNYTLFSTEEETELSEFVFDTWALYWNEFDGDPFGNYTIVIRDGSDSGGFGGVFRSRWDDNFFGFLLPHEMYHIWVGNAFQQYNDARWFTEGVTSYVGFRQSRSPSYEKWMYDQYKRYKEVYDAGRDVALSTIINTSTGTINNADNLHYSKGALVAYLLDLELKKTGHHLGEVTRILYQTYGIYKMGRPSNTEILNVFNSVSGSDFSEFFKKYVFGKDPLPIDPENFVWICHDNNLVNLPHQSTEVEKTIVTKVTPLDGMTMVYVPEGMFRMGSTRSDRSNENPQHRVSLNAYWIDQTEVTNAMYQKCIEAGVCDERDFDWVNLPNNPINGLTWFQAETYCKWAGKRLPTEAEWEKAARGPDGREYPWGTILDSGTLANFADASWDKPWSDYSINDGFAETAPVGSFPNGASPYGALDMAGNVSEWVADWYADYPPTVSDVLFNPTGAETGTMKILKDGNFAESAVGGIRSANRSYLDPYDAFYGGGVRCVADD